MGWRLGPCHIERNQWLFRCEHKAKRHEMPSGLQMTVSMREGRWPMAWLRWYAQMGLFWYEDEIDVPPDAKKPDFRLNTGSGDVARSVCLAARVRRSTAATGE